MIAAHIGAEFTSHMLLEKTVFYPAFAEQTDEGWKRLISDALQDHQQLRDITAAPQDVAEDEAFETRFHTLRDDVNQHIEDDETTMFPQAAQALATH
jgi:iron-sulfur cluster repair protein YtfE (RIC family)